MMTKQAKVDHGLVWYHENKDALMITYNNPCGCCPDSVDFEFVPVGKKKPMRFSHVDSSIMLFGYLIANNWIQLGEL